MLGPLRHDEPKSHRLCFAKKAAAFLYFALLLQDAILFTQPGQFLALRRRQRARLAFAAIDPRLLDPLAQRRLGQIEIPRRRADRLPLLEDEPDGPGLKLLTEAPTRTLGLFVCHCGHRIPLLESVHAIGSSPEWTRSAARRTPAATAIAGLIPPP